MGPVQTITVGPLQSITPSKTLTDRQAGQPPAAVAVSWHAQLRLHRTWTRLEARAKRRTIIAVAAARELAGFCWAITQIE